MRGPRFEPLPRIAVLLSALALSACADREMTERAVTYNHQVETARNDGLLLNVVRASLRHSLYSSALSDIHSPGSNSAGSISTLLSLYRSASDMPQPGPNPA